MHLCTETCTDRTRMRCSAHGTSNRFGSASPLTRRETGLAARQLGAASCRNRVPNQRPAALPFSAHPRGTCAHAAACVARPLPSSVPVPPRTATSPPRNTSRLRRTRGPRPNGQIHPRSFFVPKRTVRERTLVCLRPSEHGDGADESDVAGRRPGANLVGWSWSPCGWP